MDRNSLIGLVLIGLIMIIWFQLLAPPKPTLNRTRRADSLTQVSKKDSTAITQAPDSAAVALTAKNEFGDFAPATTGDEKLIEIETDAFKATLSTKGATLKSFVQKKYLDYNRKPFDLITAKQGALSLFFMTRDGKKINTRDLFFASAAQPNYKLSGTQQATVPFELVLPDGKKLTVLYSFSGTGYTFGFDTELNGLDSLIQASEYRIGWNGGMANSEKNKSEEATFACAHTLLGGGLDKVDADSPDTPKELKQSGDARWVSVQSKYFAAAIVAKEKTEGVGITGTRNSNDEKLVFEDYRAELNVKIPSGQSSVKNAFTLYVGPLDYEQLAAVTTGNVDKNGNLEYAGLPRMLDLGWEWFTRPFAEWLIIPTFNLMDNYISNYGVIIILFALLIKLITYPFTAASAKSMKKMSALQPQIAALQERHKDDLQKLQAETGKLYKEAGVNPLGGCLPLLLQMPILLSMFNVFRASIQIRQEPFLWATDLSVPDAVFEFPFSIPLYGDHIAIYPILMAITTVIQQRLTPQPQQNDQLKAIQYVFPVMILIIFNTTPAGLGLYYLMFNIFSILQQVWTNYQTPAQPAQVVLAPAPAPPKPKKKPAKAA